MIQEIKKESDAKRSNLRVIGAVFAIFAAISAITGYTIKSFIESVDMAIIVLGENDINIEHLENNAIVSIEFEDRANQAALIGERGKATFKDLARDIKQSSFSIRLDNAPAYEPTNPDSIYIYNGEIIYVKITQVKKKPQRKTTTPEKNEVKTTTILDSKVKPFTASTTKKNNLSGERKKYKFTHQLMNNPQITLEAKYTDFKVVQKSASFSILSFPVELKSIEKLNFIDKKTICSYGGQLYTDKTTYATSCK